MALAGCDHRSMTCTWQAPHLVGQGVGPSIVLSADDVVLSFDDPPAGRITVVTNPGGAGEAVETIQRDAGYWPSGARLHQVNGMLQLVAGLRECQGVSRLWKDTSGWHEEAMGFRLRDVGSSSTAGQLVVHGCELGMQFVYSALAIQSWDGATWRRSQIPDLCPDIDPMWVCRFAHDVGVDDGGVARVAASGMESTGYSVRDLVLWTPQGSGWAKEWVHDADVAGSAASCPILPKQGCCDRLAYTIADWPSGEKSVRVATRSGKAWAYADLDKPVLHAPPYPLPECLATAMTVVDDTTYLSIVTPGAVIVYQGGEDGWQAHTIDTPAEAVSADLLVDGQGAVHLVYEVGDTNEGPNSIYYATQTCQLARR